MNKRVLLLILGITFSFFLYQGFSIYRSQISKAASDISAHKDKDIPVNTPDTLYGFLLDSVEVSHKQVKPNENLSEILAEFNVPMTTVFDIANLPKDVFDVRKMQVGKPYSVIHESDSLKTAKGFIYYPNLIDYIVFDFEDSLKVTQGKHPVDTLEKTLSGIITTSLYESIVAEGGSPQLVTALSDVYAWEIDFFGLQQGDWFKLVYSSYEVEGKPAGFGRILTASFSHMDKNLFAFSFDQGEGVEYFDQDGNSLRKTFLKAPLKYSRISSRFSYSRLHPVLKYRRPHLGVDYAAPKGTPVQSVGDGVVISKGYNRGAGNMIKVRHNSNFTTAYLHLSRYGKGIKVGSTVSQGEIIGYVGSTGLSTGPHLDFRFYKNGVPIDPLKVDPPSSNPIMVECEEEYNSEMRLQMLKLNAAPEPQPILAMEEEEPTVVPVVDRN